MYEIELLVGGERKKYVRNEPPMLVDMTNAMKYQMHQIQMYSKDGVPDDKELDQQQKDQAKFASVFWHKQFSEKAFIEGADLAAIGVLSQALNDALGSSKEDEKPSTDNGTVDEEGTESD